jgi:hypothetical protein
MNGIHQDRRRARQPIGGDPVSMKTATILELGEVE